MSDQDSDSSCELIRTVSNPVELEFSPNNVDFQLKIKKDNGKSFKILYTLKKGVGLPYTPVLADLPGVEITFSRSLKPVYKGTVGWKEKNMWIFEEKRAGDATWVVRNIDPDLTRKRAVGDTLEGMEKAIENRGSGGIVAYGCIRCSFVAEALHQCRLHLDAEHPSWEHDTESGAHKTSSYASGAFPSTTANTASSVPSINVSASRVLTGATSASSHSANNFSSSGPSAINRSANCNTASRDLAGNTSAVHNSSFGTSGFNFQPGSSDDEPEAEVSEIAQGSAETQTPHTNPNWLSYLNRHFKTEIIAKCCQRTKDAVKINEDIKDKRTRKQTENEIVNTVIVYLEEKFGGVGTPKLKDMREIAATMTHVFPAMFLISGNIGSEDQEDPVEGLPGYGSSGNILSLNSLAQKMVYRFRDKVKKAPKREVTDEIEDEPQKKGKKKDYYGVDNVRFLGKKISPASVTVISQTNEEDDYVNREAVYEERRQELQYQFRNSSKNIQQVCRSFFAHPGHLTNQFIFVTRSIDLAEPIRKNFAAQIGFLEKFLLRADQSLDLKDKLTAIETACQVDYMGSMQFKEVQILRLVGDHFDGDGSSLIRLKEDGSVKHSGPFISAVLVNKVYVFEVWCEQRRLFGNLDIAEAIAGFLHLAFVFDLKYPAGSQTLADILQRQMAKYGDDSGTRTQRSKSSSMSKFSKYLCDLGRILSE